MGSPSDFFIIMINGYFPQHNSKEKNFIKQLKKYWSLTKICEGIFSKFSPVLASKYHFMLPKNKITLVSLFDNVSCSKETLGAFILYLFWHFVDDIKFLTKITKNMKNWPFTTCVSEKSSLDVPIFYFHFL